MLVFNFLEFFCSAVIIYCSSDFIIKYGKDLALSIGVSEYFIGLTIIAFGTSFPELVVNTNASIIGESIIAYGNIVGSNIANIALVLSIAVIINVIEPKDFNFKDILFFLVSAIFLFLFSLDGKLVFYEGFLFIVGFFWYCFNIKNQVLYSVREKKEKTQFDIFLVLILLFSFMLLIIGSRIFISNAISIAVNIGISKFAVSLTMVAIGTSLPELAMAIVASVKKEHDLLIGGIIGSNIMNVLLVLGTSIMINQINIVINLSSILLMCFLTLIVFLYSFFKVSISRIIGFILLIIYCTFIYSNFLLTI
ncbi:MAG: hypothetical protein CMG00_04520 [Candidatus Marinimicrobia bacterium]|nr:hypothetical protein [Candidatus Neomarinimicrobiota bacterium]|tara:strand:- start:2699 stop:3622 length:924 start_codon:yes stop_codon:yes gene_type:complete